MDEQETLATLVALGKAGVDFYSKASRVAANPQTRLVFQRLAQGKEAQVQFLRDQARALGGPSAGIKARKRSSAPPAIYPLSTIEPLVCFVCGQELKDAAIPAECPSCGASGYAFEVDINVAHAVRMALESEEKHLEYLSQASRALSNGEAKRLLKHLSEMEKSFVTNLKKEAKGK